ncbi:unnamed protein product [Bemisia tabaci]|uniref:Uncharacterized protein n=1 Tax=Bemisia tabaci TaxID=7038 RepID=A0A9P0ACF5_BEMTA|nr:unnamed protein product [Bemisia tabaci]
MQIGFGGRMPSPFSRRPPNRFNSMGGSFFNSGMNNFMPRTSVVDAVQDLIEDQSMFYVTFQCQPKIGKYICKMQCAQRSEMMTGICEANYCTCILKQQKKLRKKMNKRFMAAMEGFETNCSIHKKARRCKKFCKALTPDKAFTGLCTGNLCRCVTYPKTPGKKKNACTKAIKKLKKLEDTALTKLGFQPRPLSASAAQQASDIADEAIKKMKSSQSMDGCTEEDIQNHKAIIANLSQGLNLIKDHDSLETKGERAAKIGKVHEATDSISTRT